MMAGSHANRSFIPFAALRVAGLAFLTVLGLYGFAAATPHRAEADHLMCDIAVEQRTQTVSIDPYLAGSGITRADILAALAQWNELFIKYHGFPIFAEHYGKWWEADILITAHGSNRTWVANECILGFEQRGNNHTVVFMGRSDFWRNQSILPHELGHALGFGDHGTPSQVSGGHFGIQPCSLSYIGVMSYCTSPQAWFLDIEVDGISFDGRLVKGYW